jgi:5'-nucleotidase
MTQTNPPTSRDARSRWRRIALTSVVASTALALSAAPSLAGSSSQHRSRTVALQLLGINDLHGNLEPPSGSSGTLINSKGETLTVGGIAYLTTELRTLRAGQKNSLTVGVGDLIGASPQLSGMFEDEPTIAALKNLDLDVSAVGNHEFDEGVDELLRVRNGGCSPELGCFTGKPYSGSSFPYLAANVTWKKTTSRARRAGAPILPPTWVKKVDGVKVGFIGLTLEGTPAVVSAAGITAVNFGNEIAAGKAAASALSAQGVTSIVLLLHQGGYPVPANAAYDYDCNAGGGPAALSGDVTTIAQKIDPRIDVIFSAHTHQSYVCAVPDPAGHRRLVVQGSSFGRAINDTNLLIDRRSGDVIRSSVRSVNVPVTRDVTPAADQVALIAKWNALAAPVANRVVGAITSDLVKNPNDQESTIVDLVAESQLAADPDGQLAFVNSGGVRAGLTYAGSGAGEGDGNVTNGEAYTVLPFGDILQTESLTGRQIDTVLEQQFQPQSDGSIKFRHLGVSRGLRYAYSASAPVGSKIDPASITLDGVPLDPAASYRVVLHDDLLAGGDSFAGFTAGSDIVGAGVDLDAFIDYLGAHNPLTAPAPTQVTRLP